MNTQTTKTLLAGSVLGLTLLAMGCGPAPLADGGNRDASLSADGGPRDSGAGGGTGLTDAGCACGTGVCLADGGCGECAIDHDCPMAAPICDPVRNRCGLCSAANDTCGSGQRCVDGACLAGCLTGAACASGVCLPANECLNCQRDAECAAGRLCGTGVCAAPCTTSCQAGWACCQGRCVDEARDPLNCGACGTPCLGDSFCGRSECHAAVLSSVCALPVACTVLDGVYEDDFAGMSMTGALTASCTPAVTSTIADAGVLGVVTGAPLALGQLLVAGGGAFRQRAIAWLETNNLAAVRDTSTPDLYRYSRRDGGVVVSGPAANITPAHDVFVVQVVRSPTGATVLHAGGFYAQGTTAASWYVVNRLLPERENRNDTWYVVDWADTNGNLRPDATDSWTLIASGR